MRLVRLLENSGVLGKSCFSSLKTTDLANPATLTLAGVRLNFLATLAAVIRKILAISGLLCVSLSIKDFLRFDYFEITQILDLLINLCRYRLLAIRHYKIPDYLLLH